MTNVSDPIGDDRTSSGGEIDDKVMRVSWITLKKRECIDDDYTKKSDNEVLAVREQTNNLTKHVIFQTNKITKWYVTANEC